MLGYGLEPASFVFGACSSLTKQEPKGRFNAGSLEATGLGGLDAAFDFQIKESEGSPAACVRTKSRGFTKIGGLIAQLSCPIW